MQFTLSDLWHHMGLFARLVVAAMALMSVASVLVGSERLLVFRKSRRQSRAFAEGLLPHLNRRDLLAAAGAAQAADTGHLGRVLQAGLKAFQGALGLDADL